MSANRTQNSHLHRLRHRRRAPTSGKRLRKLAAYVNTQAARLTAIVGVTSVTTTEIIQAHLAPPWFVRARLVRGATTPAQVTALGINIL